MKSKKIILSAFLPILLAFGCSDELFYDNTPPTPPSNVQVFAGDQEVEIVWNFNPEGDVAGYNVYFAYEYWGKYTLIGNTPNNYFVDTEAENGEVYYYGVAAYDYDGNESELSYDEVYGIARPEGKNQSIFDYNNFPQNSGYDFSEYSVCAYNSNSNDLSADFFFENYEGTYYLNVWLDTEIQDMGYTEDISEIRYAPTSGWIASKPGENVKYSKALLGHTYIFLTWDNHYAKIRISEVTSERLIFDWAYQLLNGERQLKNVKNKREEAFISDFVDNGRILHSSSK